eukprot:TRINITY_DN15838_c0_g1_i1.p1 TRINITY_DN15838_c0_g1~~TRINITY_DN15838_c0_g1_i1.p1  ORF type:complete len:525 (+),score=213.34 TRINITY_DN15838_c0_g1_i1:98-1576(+)
MLCAISGVVPEHPVVSKKSGLVFEKRLLETHLETSGKCPVTGDALTQDDLVEVRSSDIAKPRPAAAQSIPGLLQAQQNEWDALMLENFELKKQLDMVRQELSHSLYRYDAACRVIARIMKERDEALQSLASFDAHAAAAKPVKDKKPSGPVAPGVAQEIEDLSKQLFKGRKNRQVPEALATREELAQLQQKSSRALHSTTAPGVLCLDHWKGLTATGGADSVAVLFDEEAGKVVQKLQGHTKSVRDVILSRTREHLYTCSDDATTRLWSKEGDEYKTVAKFEDHTQGVSGLAMQPSGNYLVTCSADGSWVFYDVSGNASPAAVYKNETAGAGLLSCAFHADGKLLACGTDQATLCIWDVLASGKPAAALKSGNDRKTLTLACSENGYSLATGYETGVVKIWDLRKPDKEAELIQFADNDPHRPTPVNKVQYDSSAKYLAICTDAVRLYTARERSEIITLKEHSAPVTDCVWGLNSKSLFTGSMDRQTKIYGL